MKITVKSSEETWKSPDGKIKLYKINLDNGTALQTYSGKIAAGGEFEVETYDKNGNTFVKQIVQENSQQSGGKQFKADPESRDSIEWQTSLKAAVEVVRDYYQINLEEIPKGDFGIEAYAKEVDKVAVHFKNLINIKPKAVTVDEVKEVLGGEEVDDLPPVDVYDEQ